MLDALGDIQRRKLLAALAERTPQGGSVDITDTEVETDDVARRIELKHIHLPKLADYGFVEWDRESADVAPGPAFDEIRPLVALLVENEAELPPECL